MSESKELRSARALYIAKLNKYGALTMPASAHYTEGYKDGSAILWAVAQTCAEAERRLEEITRQRDLAIEFVTTVATSPKLTGSGWQEQAAMTLTAIKESEV